MKHPPTRHRHPGGYPSKAGLAKRARLPGRQACHRANAKRCCPWTNHSASQHGSFGSHRRHRQFAAPVGTACDHPRWSSGSALGARTPGLLHHPHWRALATGASSATAGSPCQKACGGGQPLQPIRCDRPAKGSYLVTPSGWRRKSPKQIRRPVPFPTSASCRCFAPGSPQLAWEAMAETSGSGSIDPASLPDG